MTEFKKGDLVELTRRLPSVMMGTDKEVFKRVFSKKGIFHSFYLGAYLASACFVFFPLTWEFLIIFPLVLFLFELLFTKFFWYKLKLGDE